ncbi:MAG: hypothetical protein K2U26_20025 [Cyclobacteriaceae bacterium]|nr:hypothetical protein [Cyclobacteriaceae bacterium]
MIEKKVLVIGRHPEIMQRVLTLLQQHGYNAIGKQENEEALTAFNNDSFQAVVIGGGVDSTSRALFHREFSRLNPCVKIIDAHPLTVLQELKSTFS